MALPVEVPSDDLPDPSPPPATASADQSSMGTEVPAGDLPTAPGEAGGALTAFTEGAAQGALGPIAPFAERVGGRKPEDILATSEAHPIVHGLGEAVGFGAGMLANPFAKAGEAVAGGLGLMGEGAGIGTRLAAGAAKMATEMGLYQASDEASKVVLDAPNSAGQAAVNIGLSAILGGALGAPLTGLGEAAKGVANSQFLKDFTDRLAARGAGIHPNELMEKEFNDAIGTYHAMNDELTGPQGLKSQALAKVMPQSMTPEIRDQAQTIVDQGQKAISKMVDSGVSDRYIQKFTQDLNGLQETLTDPAASVADHFDALNEYKKNLYDYSKGNFGPFAVPRYHEAYDFLNITKGLGYDAKVALEDPEVWGKAADLQKNLNRSWTDVLPAVKDAQSKFMEKVGGEYVPSPAKFQTYLNQNGKATTETIRQKMMGNFVDGLQNHFDQIGKIYDAAGVENPYPPVGMNTLKESLQKTSAGTKLADTWFTKVGPQGVADFLGGATGGLLGHATGIPEAGFAGAYLGKWALGPVFGSVIKPLMEKGPDVAAFRAAMAYGKNVIEGNAQLTKSAANLFSSGMKTVPSHYLPSDADLDKLSKQVQQASLNPATLPGVTGNVGHYLPEHAQSVGQTAGAAVTYLNSLKPQNPRQNPLDSHIPVSKAQEAPYRRALSIAEQPLMALQHIKNGTLLPQDVQTLKAVYPDYYNKMSQELMGAMANHLSKDETVPYRTRQSLSLFLGQPMDSTMTPTGILSAQSAYAPQPMDAGQSQPGSKPKKSTSKLEGIAKSSMTASQSRESRLSKA